MSQVFAALGDENRQYLLEALSRHARGASATTLAAPLSVTRQAVDKHLRVLERAGLVSSARGGREVLYAVRRDELDRSAAWLTQLADSWDRRQATAEAEAQGRPHTAH